MIFKHRIGAASVLAAAWYSGTAIAAGYNTQIYSVTADVPNGLLYIDGVDLAPTGQAGNAHVQLLGQALAINEASSSGTHIEATLPASMNLYPGTGYQLYVSPDRAQASGAASQTDQALFTLYVVSASGSAAGIANFERAKVASGAAVGGAQTSVSATTSAAPPASGTHTTIWSLLARASSPAGHTAVASPLGVTPADGSTFTLPYTGSLASSGSLITLTNTSTGDALDGTSNSTAADAVAIRGTISSTSSGSLSAGVRGINNATSGTGVGVWGSSNASGAGVYGTSVNGYGVRGSATGNGIGILSGSTSGPGLYATSNNSMSAEFVISNTASSSDNLVISNLGKGRGLFLNNNNSSATANALEVDTNTEGDIPDHTQGNAGEFFNNNTNGVGAGVRVEVNSIFGNNGTAGVYGNASGTGGYGGYFDHTNASGYGLALFVTTAGLGVGAHIENTNASNAQNTLEAVTNGTGVTANFSNTNSSNTSNTLSVTTNTEGDIPDHTQGNAGNFFNNNTNGVGAGVRGEVNSIFGNNGTAGVYGNASGTGGYGGYFDHTDSSGFGIALQAVNDGQGVVFVADQEGSSGDLALFEVAGVDVARIDRTGKGYFDGGTQNSGADLAEFVPVTGATPQVGDVVEIDPEHPDSFRLCSEANTTRVAGIISTAPGVTLNAKHGAIQEVSGPALALAGRVPTKVNAQGGPIRSGDLLVASSEAGRAMRAPAHPEPGTVIGKAMQDSDQAEDTVEVLVMLR